MGVLFTCFTISAPAVRTTSIGRDVTTGNISLKKTREGSTHFRHRIKTATRCLTSQESFLRLTRSHEFHLVIHDRGLYSWCVASCRSDPGAPTRRAIGHFLPSSTAVKWSGAAVPRASRPSVPDRSALARYRTTCLTSSPLGTAAHSCLETRQIFETANSMGQTTPGSTCAAHTLPFQYPDLWHHTRDITGKPAEMWRKPVWNKLPVPLPRASNGVPEGAASAPGVNPGAWSTAFTPFLLSFSNALQFRLRWPFR